MTGTSTSWRSEGLGSSSEGRGNSILTETKTENPNSMEIRYACINKGSYFMARTKENMRNEFNRRSITFLTLLWLNA